MNIQEALKSGKRFRIEGYETWMREGGVGVAFRCDEILRDDWETQEEKIEITRQQFELAMSYTVQFSHELRNYPMADVKDFAWNKLIEVIDK